MAHDSTRKHRREMIMNAVRKALKKRNVCIPSQALESLAKVLHVRRFYDIKVVCGPEEAEEISLMDYETSYSDGRTVGRNESISKVVYGGRPNLGINYRRQRHDGLNLANCEECQQPPDFNTSKTFVVILERHSWVRMRSKADSDKSELTILIYAPQKCGAKSKQKQRRNSRQGGG